MLKLDNMKFWTQLWSLPQGALLKQYNKIRYKGKSIQELDLSDCKCCIPSHRLMPSGTNCQQRLDLGAEVLKWSIGVCHFRK
ncbi:hypothetical protein F2Q70_00042474 [Brassica cretica]|uniref:Uncharacterized protein n=1 Tax=Brassica cretica TaxID=69181 RepID=A0A8S9KFR1_BRACR|nr:hypothetical protein F2Q70_00042474 [Brassica cretica]KAF3518582.1 hypothetical protein DY000_02058757 [Brassica cretica]